MAKRKNKNILGNEIPTKIGAAIILAFAFLSLLFSAKAISWQCPKPNASVKPLWISESKKTPAVQPDSTDWPVYENEDYGFSFAHPPGTEVTRHMEGNGNSIDGFLVYDNNGFEQSIWIYKTKCSIKCFQENVVGWMPKTKIDGKDITVGDLKGYEINFDDGGKVRREVYFRDLNATVLYFEFDNLKSANSRLSPDQEKMLNSFRFD